MRITIVYDSAYGNTEKVANALAAAADPSDEVNLRHVHEAEAEDLESTDLLIVGSPTQGGRPTIGIQKYLDDQPSLALIGMPVTAFDTRLALNEHGVGLHILMKTVGFAAGRIANSLVAKGGDLVVEPEGFIVEDKLGPLKLGELQRASEWMDTLKKAVKKFANQYA